MPAYPVFAKSGQDFLLLRTFSAEVGHQLPAARRKAGDASLTGTAALVGVGVATVTDDTWPPTF